MESGKASTAPRTAPTPARGRWKGGPAVHGIGRSRGGATTKVHLIVDALGLPLTFEVTEGQRHDIVPAPALVQRTRPRRLLADKAYSTHDFRAVLARNGLRRSDSVVIVVDQSAAVRQGTLQGARRGRMHLQPPQAGARRFATRYEKTLRNYAAVVAIGCALLWLRI